MNSFDMYIWTAVPCGYVVAHSPCRSILVPSGDRYSSVAAPLHIRGTSALIAKCSFQSLCLLSTWYSRIFCTLLQPRYSNTLSLSLRIVRNSISQRRGHQSKRCSDTKTDRCFYAGRTYASHLRTRLTPSGSRAQPHARNLRASPPGSSVTYR
jgi:hypothetical protein